MKHSEANDRRISAAKATRHSPPAPLTMHPTTYRLYSTYEPNTGSSYHGTHSLLRETALIVYAGRKIARAVQRTPMMMAANAEPLISRPRLKSVLLARDMVPCPMKTVAIIMAIVTPAP